VNDLCKDLNPLELFEDEVVQKKEIAECTFENISILNIDGLNPDNFEGTISEICDNPEYSSETICQ
jgi:hypothetical protein